MKRKKKPLDFTKISAALFIAIPILILINPLPPNLRSLISNFFYPYFAIFFILGLVGAYFSWKKEKFMLLIVLCIVEIGGFPCLISALHFLNLLLIVLSYHAFPDVD